MRKSPISPVHGSVVGKWGGVFGAVLLLLPAVSAHAAQVPPPDQAYTLFMGTDIDVNRKTGLHPIRDFVRGNFLINEQDALVRVPISARTPVEFNISKKLKLTGSAVRIEGLVADRAYTAGRDPARQFLAAASAAAAASQDANAAAAKVIRAAEANNNNVVDPKGTETERFADESRNAMRESNDANQAMGSDLNNAGAQAGRMADQLAEGNFDAVEISFKVSAAQPVSDAYVVAIAQYRAPADKPGFVRNWVYAEELGAVDDRPRRVFIKQGGFPPGFQLLSREVHFYRRGRELASNVSEKAVPLTFDEAHEYVVIEYLTTNKGATLAPSVALGISAGDFSPRFTDAHLQREIFVKVDKAGRPQGAFRDAACTQAAGDEQLDRLVQRVRFKPALQAGKAVDGVARLKIADLAV